MRTNWFDKVWGLRRDPENVLECEPCEPCPQMVDLHICTLPTYWTPYVAVGTTFICPRCERVWWLNRDSKWEYEAGM